MRVERASHLGMCFGVREAIAKVVAAARRERVTILGELVHNETVVEELAAGGIRCCHELDEVRTPLVAITAHGASDRRRAAMRERGLRVLDTTCPIVRSAHQTVLALARDGYHPVIIGKPGHVEVRGLTEDLAAFDVIACEEDVAGLRPQWRFGIASQTTQPIDRVAHLVSLIRRRFPWSEVRVADTVCVPTKLRQQAAAALAERCDAVVVVGGASSNNTRELCATCSRSCGRVVQVQQAADLRPEPFVGTSIVGLTAGTSTPAHVIDEVEERLREFGKRRGAAA